MMNKRTLNAVLFWLMCASVQNAFGQYTLLVSDLGNQLYGFRVAGISPLDRVVYRFSDGHHLSQPATDGNPQAMVSRKFPAGSNILPNATAYVLRKNGPLGIATNTSAMSIIVPCTNCDPPPTPSLPAGATTMQMLWSHASNPGNFTAALQDNTTLPAFNTPTQPWHILALTVSPDDMTDRVQVNIPDGLQVSGVILKNRWYAASGSIAGDPHVQSLIIHPSESVSMVVQPEAAMLKPFQVYLVCSGFANGTSVQYVAFIEGKDGHTYGDSFLSDRVRKDPHDPNSLTVDRDYACTNDRDPDPLSFRVDFQNEGKGKAEEVEVCISVPNHLLNYQSAILTGASVPLGDISTIANDQGVCFRLNEIGLPGLQEEPFPGEAATRAWIEFTVEPRRCTHAHLASHHNASVTFLAHNGDFRETVYTNSVEYKMTPCEEVNEPCLNSPGNTRSSSDEAEDQTLRCYPTFFQNTIYISGPEAGDDNPIIYTMYDCMGRIWKQGVLTDGAIDTGSLPSGAYFVRIEWAGDIVTKKMLKG